MRLTPERIAALIFAALTAAPTVAAAPEWVTVGSDSANTLYYNPKSVSRSGDVVRVRTRMVVADDPLGYGSFIILEDLNCRAQTWTMIAAQGFDTGGKLYRSVEVPADKARPEPIFAGETTALLYRKLCPAGRALPPPPIPGPPPVPTTPGTDPAAGVSSPAPINSSVT